LCRGKDGGGDEDDEGSRKKQAAVLDAFLDPSVSLEREEPGKTTELDGRSGKKQRGGKKAVVVARKTQPVKVRCPRNATKYVFSTGSATTANGRWRQKTLVGS
jgi:hypothetical protein